METSVEKALALALDVSDEAISARYGDRLRRLREGAGLSQREVAETLGVSHTAVGKAEKGAASEELLVPLERLYGFKDWMAAPKHPLRRRVWVDARNAGIASRPRVAERLS